jgi:hypothetical protein
VLESEKREKAKELAGAAKTQRSLAHRTVRCARLVSGELATLGNSSAAYGYNSPDCPVSQRPPAQWSAAKSVGDAWPAPTVGRGTGLSGVHQTVSGAPTSLKIQWSAAPGMEGDPHRTVYSDCPVRHPTEGKNCLPYWVPTAPSSLEAIKGTPRRMEELPRHSLIIPKHQDSILAHSILCDCDLSSI